ncbi:hypothetical protein AcW1_006165 [Taiwanofungus camphoratus]|nr:hypothetical protein AcV7_008580 [Antrodia cinnamomea]KAI0957939.1 hypothetical protein AcW1_006165 [Antrodia cinnamomea]
MTPLARVVLQVAYLILRGRDRFRSYLRVHCDLTPSTQASQLLTGRLRTIGHGQCRLQLSYIHNTPCLQSHTVDIPQELKTSLRKFRFARRDAGSAALVVKIDKQKLIMEEVEQFDNISIDDLAEELPENSPRYVVLSYELIHGDGRKSFPLILVNWAPTSSEIGLLTLHASAFLDFQATADISKVIEVRDGAEGFTKEFVDAKLLHGQ